MGQTVFGSGQAHFMFRSQWVCSKCSLNKLFLHMYELKCLASGT